MVFNDSWVGVPGTTLTNWPDEYIHSSDDDLWQVDPTQLKRNAFVVAATAWWLASAGEPEANFLARFVAARGSERLGRDLATAEAWISNGEGTEAERTNAAHDLLAVALAKEKAAVDSTEALGSSREVRAAASTVLDGVAQTLRQRIPATSPADHGRDPVRDRLDGPDPAADRRDALRVDGARARGRRQTPGSGAVRPRREGEGRGGPPVRPRPEGSRPLARRTTTARSSRPSWRRRS